jgi:hypothetical protein
MRDRVFKWPMRGLAILDMGAVVIELAGERHCPLLLILYFISGCGSNYFPRRVVVDILVDAIGAVGLFSGVPHYHGRQHRGKSFGPETSFLGMLHTITSALYAASDHSESISCPATR